MKWAVLTLRVPINGRYPWKTTQVTLDLAVQELLGNACDGVWWHDAVDQGQRIETSVKVLDDTTPALRRSIWWQIANLTRDRR